MGQMERKIENVEVLYEDGQVLVVVKPVGVAAQSSGTLAQDMVSLIKNYLVAKKEKIYVGVVHRLDTPVGGIMVFAKTKEAAANLSQQVSERKIQKKYYALVCGQFDFSVDNFSKSRKMVDYLVKDEKLNLSRIASPDEKGAKKAELEYQVLKTKEMDGEIVSLVEITLHTGRHHQIRVQMAGAGHPLVGDRKYNTNSKIYARNITLASVYLGFYLPSKKGDQYVEFFKKPSGGLWENFL